MMCSWGSALLFHDARLGLIVFVVLGVEALGVVQLQLADDLPGPLPLTRSPVITYAFAVLAASRSPLSPGALVGEGSGVRGPSRTCMIGALAHVHRPPSPLTPLPPGERGTNPKQAQPTWKKPPI